VSIRRDHWLSSAWGLAEATLFFFVPDVLLTWMALDRQNAAYTACWYALAGALLGGAIVFAWGATDAPSARAALDAVPGIRSDMITSVREDLTKHGPAALFSGPPRGVPYKIYAAEWGALGGNLVIFLLVSIPARVVRFLLAVAITHFVRRHTMARLSLRTCRAVHLLFWLAFYAWYFHIMED